MSPPSTDLLLERDAELARVDAALASAREGAGRLVLLEAAAGVGKTTLLAAAAARSAAAGLHCLRARGSELERGFAYGCVRQLFEQRARDAPFDDAAAGARPVFTAVPGDPEPFAVLHGLYWLLDRIAAASPSLLLLDDAQWVDGESLGFLEYLAPRLDGLPVAVLLAFRPEATPAGLARLASAPEAEVLRPQPLSVPATAEVCAASLGDAAAGDLAAACHAATGGNPFLLRALLRELVERGIDDPGQVRGIGPAAVARSALLRLRRSPPSATALVRALAVLGDGAALAEVAALAGLSEPDAADAADVLLGLGLVRSEASLRFEHAIVREAVYADLGGHRRQAAHARAAALLADRGAPDERVAAQVAAAPPAGDAERVALLRRVAAAALRRGAPAAAAVALERALAEPPAARDAPGVRFELGAAELRLGRPGAAAHLGAALGGLEDATRRTGAARMLALAHTMAGEPATAVAVLEAVADALPGAADEPALRLAADVHAHAQQAGQPARRRAADRLAAYATLTGATPGARLALACLAFDRARRAPTAVAAADAAIAGLADGRLLAEQEVDVAGPYYHLIMSLLATDALDLVGESLTAAMAQARERVSLPAVAYVATYQGRAALRRGDLARAEADGRTALELLDHDGITLGRGAALSVLVEALVDRGALAAADALVPSGTLAASITENPLLLARGRLRLAQGATDAGLADLEAFGRADADCGPANPLASRWRSHAALALAVSGAREAAQRLAAEDAPRARAWASTDGAGLARHALALAHADVDGLRAAAEALAGTPARLSWAHALTDYGAALRRANRRAEARAALAPALREAARCGALALVERARTEARAAGGPSADPFGPGAAQLTVSERRVAELAAAGRNNPEIAQELFITRKTVETHLGRTYRKLGIARRGDLSAALAGADPPPA